MSVPQHSDIVYQSNDLIEAIYDSDLTPTEHKVLRYAASKIRESSDNFPDVVFTVKEFMKASGISGNGYHQQFEKIADELTRKRIKVKNKEEIGWFPWLSALVYKNGVVHLSFNTHIKELIFELKNGYTKYEFKLIGAMRSSYTIRLFELIKQYAKIGYRRLNVETLRQMLGVGEKYKRYSHFKYRVLQQAKKELDEINQITFDFEEVKQGRKVVEIILHIQVNDEKFVKTEIDNPFLKEAELLLDSYNYNIKIEDIKNWEKYGIDLLSEVLKEIEGRDIKHPKAYIEKVLERKYESKLIDHDDPNILINKFILECRKSKEVIPEWFREGQFKKFMSKYDYSDEDIEKLWKENGEHILDCLKKIKK